MSSYRTIKTDNPIIQGKVLAVPRMSDLLIFAGFDPVGPLLVFPADASPEALRIAGMVAAKALQLSSQRGFSGCATSVNDVTSSDSKDSSSVSASTARHRNSPGFRWVWRTGRRVQKPITIIVCMLLGVSRVAGNRFRKRKQETVVLKIRNGGTVCRHQKPQKPVVHVFHR